MEGESGNDEWEEIKERNGKPYKAVKERKWQLGVELGKGGEGKKTVRRREKPEVGKAEISLS